MLKIAALTVLLLQPATSASGAEPLRYDVDMTHPEDHRFRVVLQVDSLSEANRVFQFAATAPGTYQVMDIGRFVDGFAAFDASGKPIHVERVSTNQWSIETPTRVRQIRYTVIGTRDTTPPTDVIQPMVGSSLQSDYALINGQAVIGFPAGMQAAPISIAFHYPAAWKAGTALKVAKGRYHADDFDQLVDSPALFGDLTQSRMTVAGAPVTIYSHSPGRRITAQQLQSGMKDMLLAAGKFIGKLPVDHYVFLYDFGAQTVGAWEHSYSSEYVIANTTYTPTVATQIRDMAAHEFFHVVTPLNLHSEIIEHFNFAKPTPSEHLWLYEGTTEWAAHKMQLEAGLESATAYLAGLGYKDRVDRSLFDSTYSLSQLAFTSYSDSGQRQYGNIYMRGALVAGLLDIRLLELSGGQHGLRDLIHALSLDYGKRRAFPEDSLFTIIARRTSPEVMDFFDRYVRHAEALPLEEYYRKLGITAIREGVRLTFSIDSNPTPEQRQLRAAWLGGGHLTDPVVATAPTVTPSTNDSTPARMMSYRWRDAFNSRDTAVVRAFFEQYSDPATFAISPIADRLKRYREAIDRFLPFTLVKVQSETPDSIIWAATGGGVNMTITMVLTADRKHYTQFTLAMAPP